MPKGEYKGSTGNTDCASCSAGYYQDTLGQESCKIVPIGRVGATTSGDATVQVTGATMLVDCSNGFYKSVAGASDCADIPAGSRGVNIYNVYASLGAVHIEDCPNGTYSTNGNGDCVDVSAGYEG